MDEKKVLDFATLEPGDMIRNLESGKIYLVDHMVQKGAVIAIMRQQNKKKLETEFEKVGADSPQIVDPEEGEQA